MTRRTLLLALQAAAQPVIQAARLRESIEQLSTFGRPAGEHSRTE